MERQLHPRVQQLLERRRIRQHTPNWYQERKLRLTASDFGAVLGVSKFATPQKIFMRKTGQSTDSYNNPACKWGSEHEDMAACAYMAATGVELIEEDIGLLIHPEYSELGCSPDRVAKYFPLCVEIKCPYKRKIEPGVVPEMYVPQIQGQLEICDLDVCHFVQFVPATMQAKGQLDIVEIERDREWFNSARTKLQAFWKDVVEFYAQKGVPVGSVVGDNKRGVLDLRTTKPKPVAPLKQTCSIVQHLETPAHIMAEHAYEKTQNNTSFNIDLAQYDVTIQKQKKRDE